MIASEKRAPVFREVEGLVKGGGVGEHVGVQEAEQRV